MAAVGTEAEKVEGGKMRSPGPPLLLSASPLTAAYLPPYRPPAFRRMPPTTPSASQWASRAL